MGAHQARGRQLRKLTAATALGGVVVTARAHGETRRAVVTAGRAVTRNVALPSSERGAARSVYWKVGFGLRV